MYIPRVTNTILNYIAIVCFSNTSVCRRIQIEQTTSYNRTSFAVQQIFKNKNNFTGNDTNKLFHT